MLLIGGAGVMINVMIAYAVRKSDFFGYAFGTLCFCQAIADVGICGTLVFLTGGISLLDPSFHATYLGRRSGQLLVFFWQVALWSHFFAAINRFVAINFPLHYKWMFGKRKIMRYVAAIWLIAMIQSAPYFIPSCSKLFDPVSFTYFKVEGLCGKILEQYDNNIVMFITLVTIGTIDTLTFVRLVKFRTKLLERSSERQNKRSEILFFYQATAQSSLFVFSLVFFFYLVKLNLQTTFDKYLTSVNKGI
ncbi:hypothetical protein QR680_016327 [Steinernema hermaphroditum]|uniref:G-protein coupled receptors family 1 profile domain-containing protein n=1 Tax=Steinernema hermaphroditum TaxID=289476 RepID=A0AA39LME0_9BILA|nr:hypothetical protein QR680_016327 [Steinernema hermaphroditum]